MKIATIKRGVSTDQGTAGTLFTADGTLTSRTLELPWRDLDGNGLGDSQLSCITPGTYILKWGVSPSKGPCYEVTDVKGRSHVLVHSANFAGDVKKGWIAELLGCIALGADITAFAPDQTKHPGAKVQMAISGSRAACQKFNEWGATQDIQLTITGGKP